MTVAWQTLPEVVEPDGVFVDGDWVESKDQDPDGEVRLIQLADIGDGVFRDRSNRFLTTETAKELGCTYLLPGDVLIARMPEPLGRACVFPDIGRPAVTAVDVCIFRPPSNINPRYVMYMINTPQFRAEVHKLQSGTTRKRISRKNLATIRLPIRDSTAQVEVVDEIERQLTRLDMAENTLRRSLAQLTRWRTTVITRRMDMPGPTAPLGDHIDHLTSGSRGWAKYYSGSGAAFLRIGNLDHWTISLDVTNVQRVSPPDGREASRTRVQAGDVLVSITADIGMVAVVPAILGEAYINQHVALVRVKGGLVPSFVAWYLVGPGRDQLHALQRGATKLGLGLDDIRSVRVPVLDVDEQEAVVAQLEAEVSVANTLIKDVKAALVHGRIIGKAILAESFPVNGAESAMSL